MNEEVINNPSKQKGNKNPLTHNSHRVNKCMNTSK